MGTHQSWHEIPVLSKLFGANATIWKNKEHETNYLQDPQKMDMSYLIQILSLNEILQKIYFFIKDPDIRQILPIDSFQFPWKKI